MMSRAMNAFIPSDTPQLARFTIDEFPKLDRSGALDRFGRMELIDGEIYRGQRQIAFGEPIEGATIARLRIDTPSL